MARKARLFIPGAIYHVYCRTARGERVFSADAEAEAFTGTVQLLRDTDCFDLLAWCLLGNHYHLVLRTGDVPLWRTMARLQGRIGRDFNRRHGNSAASGRVDTKLESSTPNDTMHKLSLTCISIR